MNKRNKKIRWILLSGLVLLFLMTGCARVLETASDRFDDMVGSIISTGQDSFDDNGNVTVRILTATPSPGPTLSPTPTLTPTPTPRPDNMEPEGEVTEEWVYAVSTVNIRAKWNTDSAIVGSLGANDQIYRMAVLENGWSKVSYNGTVAYINSNYLTTQTPSVVGTVHLNTTKYAYEAVMNGDDVILLEVQNILQNPDLPAGAEVTCLAIVMHYLGEYADKVALAENYLTIAEPGTASPYVAYLGDPKVAEGSYGCYAPVLVDAANRYLADKGSRKRAVDVSGSTREDLFRQVKRGTPVIVWGTTNMASSSVIAEWELEGETFQWLENSHCTVLIGYNKTKGTVIVADPLRGIIEVDMEKYFARYNDRNSSAVIISN